MELNIIIDALYARYRFPSVSGDLTLEDLFRLNLRSTKSTNTPTLNAIANELNMRIAACGCVDFIDGSDEITLLQRKLDIVKFVIAHVKGRAETAKQTRAKEENRQNLLALIERKKNDLLAEESIEELEQRLAAL
ncbi:MAG: hypothetical protein ACK5SY_00100 [bacterium]|jgi:hypothetical protein|uniref:Uncharacterized protein n=1 Tax=Bacteriophage sp. TaxID=38018 RepID=A0A7G9A433_9VIRU|nr:MAG: hypothetical protein [Bacteriophage sp.]